MTIKDQTMTPLEASMDADTGNSGPGIRPVDFSTASDVVIRMENIWKQYRLGTINHGTLARDLQSWWARLRGKEDPNQRIDLAAPAANRGEGEAEDRFWALRDVTFDVRQGDIVGIIGRNGAGKSTLLKILSQVTTPTRGEIKIRGRIASLLEVGTGFHPELTGRENVFLNGAILGMSKTEIAKKFDEIVDFSGVEKFIDTPVKRYSSGMYVRLAFAVAAHLEPEILIVDEVLAVGDAQFQKKCLGKMEEVGREGRTVLFVSHNMNTINRLCQKAILLSSGGIIKNGVTSEVIPYYLSNSSSKLIPYVEYADDKDKLYQVLSISLRDFCNKIITRQIEADEGFIVNIMYKLAKQLPGGYAGFTIRNGSGEVVFMSDNRDSSESFHMQEHGIVEVAIRFPAPLLVPGQYTLSAAICEQGRGAIDSRADAINFEIVNVKSVRTTWAGSVHIPLTWSKI